MDYLVLARVAKLAALLGFALPWVTVSCSDTVLIEATGWQLMSGDIRPAADVEGAANEAEPSIPVILACVGLGLGLLLGLLLKGRNAAAALLAGAVAGIALSYYAVANMRSEIAREIRNSQSQAAGGEMAQAIASAIRVEEQEGYWLTLGGAGVAAALSLVVLAGAGAVRREGEPTPGM